MSVHDQNRISQDRPQVVWPFPEATSVGVPDGPMAVISAALKGRMAEIDVRYENELIQYSRNAAGETVERSM